MTEEKVRAAMKIIIKELLIFFGSFLIMIGIASAACIASTYSEKKVEAKATMQRKVVAQSKTESQDCSLPVNFKSTMCGMLTGKETVKGDLTVELEKKVAAERKKKALERKKKRIMRKKKKEIKRQQRQQYSSSNLELMAHLIYGEAGDQGDACQQAVGMVVINRINDKSFKVSSVREAIYAPGQYACTTDGNFDRKPSKQAYKNAKAVLSGNTIIDVPEDVVYQSQFSQGSGVWRKLGTETFCRK